MPTILEQLMKELQAAQGGGLRAGQRDLPSGSPDTLLYHGPGGLFAQYGVERDIISTRIHPMGLADQLPAVGSQFTNPLFGFFTGFQGVTGTVANGVCDDPETAGPGKVCRQTAQFGRYSYQTRELDITRVGRYTDRSEPLDLRILNDPLLMGTGTNTTPTVPGSPDLRSEMLMRMVEVGVDFQNKLTKQLYYGNPTNSSAGGGYKEFPGLDILVGTGKIDAITNIACPSLDSDLKNYNYRMIDDGTATGGIVNVMTYLLRYLKHNASKMNMNPVEWVIAMREDLFYELTAIWPCSYLTYRCVFGAAASQANQVVDANATIEMRDAMRNGNFLVVDGVRYNIVLDDAIEEENHADNGAISTSCFASDIFVLPLTIRGGFRSLYWEYFNYNDGPMTAVQQTNGLGNYYWTDNGKFFWHQKPPNNFCVQQVAVTEPRVILRTPQLAGRISNIQYCPLQHMRDAYPDDPYYVDGGVTTQSPGPSYYNEW